MRRALVTGGAGLVGWFIVQRLVSDGWEVAVSGRTPPPEAMFGDAVRFHRLPLAPETDFGPALAGAELLVHCAFQHEPGRYRGGEGGDPPGFRRANLEGSVALFEAAKAAGVPAARVGALGGANLGLGAGSVSVDALRAAHASGFAKMMGEG